MLPAVKHDEKLGHRLDRLLATAALTALACLCAIAFVEAPGWGSCGFAALGLLFSIRWLSRPGRGRHEALTAILTTIVFTAAWSFGLVWHLAALLLVLMVVGATAMAIWSIRPPIRH